MSKKDKTLTRKASPTPRPWHMIEHSWNETGIYSGDDIPRIAALNHGDDEEQPEDVGIANAALIVRAVNAHDGLVAALRGLTTAACALKECLGVQGDELEAGGVACAPELNAVADAEKVARAALRLAKKAA